MIKEYLLLIMAKVFKDYPQGQTMLFPPSLDELISSNHPVRLVNEIIDKLDLDPLFRKYRGGGASSYHPRMLLKVLVYGYLDNVYSSRKLEAHVQQNIHYMWLSGMQRPDHNTINRFRSEKLKGVVRHVFSQVVLMLAESGHLSLKRIFTDGTKIEANANRYTFVWGKSIKTHREKMEKRLEELWNYAETVAREELSDQRPTTFEAVDPEKVAETIEKINQAIGKKKVDPVKKQQLKYAQKHFVKNLRKYQKQEEILAGRNSYSKTDHDATFMKMKEDHMKNGQLKPGYNLQFSTNKQFIVHYSLHPNPTDTLTLIPHLESFKETYSTLPTELTADAGYGSEENYTYLEKVGTEAYVKYNTFDQTEKRKRKKDKYPFRVEQLYYDEVNDRLICPMGQPMHFIGTKKQKTKSGFEQTLRRYQAIRCEGCPLRGGCHKAKGARIVEINFKSREYRQKAKERLESKQGVENRKQRSVDVEPVFGHIKYNRGFKRFMLRGSEKVKIETGLLAIAHNLLKASA